MTKKPALAALALGVATAVGLTGCSPLNAFDTLIPKDRGSVMAIKDAAFGPDERQRLDVYRPRGSPASKLPIIVFIYGGSWQSGSKAGYSFVGRALAARGFVTVIADYRLVPEVHYPAFVEDNAAAVRWAIANAPRFGGDPDRIVVAGHSAGAYGAAMLALDGRWLGADRNRVRGLIGIAGPYDFLPLDGPITRAAFGNAPDLSDTQPVTHAGRGDPPSFLATAADDRTVRAYNSDSLAARLRAGGVRVERVTYPRVGHVGILTAIAKPLRGRASVLDDMTAFAHEVTR
ncbi:MAG TPA: alpha/beta hydrolase [Sphingomicrobium sp.]|nr:alpha/beta hydrolase [Sphingomicrobium sp.]